MYTMLYFIFVCILPFPKIFFVNDEMMLLDLIMLSYISCNNFVENKPLNMSTSKSNEIIHLFNNMSIKFMICNIFLEKHWSEWPGKRKNLIILCIKCSLFTEAHHYIV